MGCNGRVFKERPPAQNRHVRAGCNAPQWKDFWRTTHWPKLRCESALKYAAYFLWIHVQNFERSIFLCFRECDCPQKKREKQKNSNTQSRPSDIIDLNLELSKLFHRKSQLPLFWKEEKGIQDLDEIKNRTLDLVTPTEKDEKTPLDDQQCQNAAQINCVSKTFFCSLKELNWNAICDREQRKIFIRNAKWTSYENILIKKMIFVVRIFIGFSINYADQIQTEKMKPQTQLIPMHSTILREKWSDTCHQTQNKTI